MKMLEKISNVLDTVCGVLIVFFIGAMVIITSAQIVCRTWFTSLTWSDEVTRYLLIWSTFLGASCVYKHSGNIAITFIQEAFPPRVTKALRICVQLICFVLFAVLCWYGTEYAMKLKKTATSLPVKMKYIFAVVPVSMGICMIHALVLLLKEWKGKEGKD
ncbi:MAG: TRAP transporter small permease [Blautia sp.]|nr:TRAP transporter small permease [Blautia sp.]